MQPSDFYSSSISKMSLSVTSRKNTRFKTSTKLSILQDSSNIFSAESMQNSKTKNYTKPTRLSALLQEKSAINCLPELFGFWFISAINKKVLLISMIKCFGV
jgi:hypothetical protein